MALIAIAVFDYRHLEMFAPPAFVVFILLLAAVDVFGTVQSGSQRWLSVGGVLVQPTEAGKFLIIIFMAWYLSWFHDQMHKLQYLIVALVLLLGPLVLIYLQPNLGMTLTYVPPVMP